MRTDFDEVPGRVHIPSSDVVPPPSGGPRRPSPRTGTKALVAVLAVAISGIVLGAILTAPEEAETVVPAPFETIPSDPVPSVDPPAAWSAQGLPGSGPILAMGSVAGSSIAVSTDGGRALIWELTDDLWRLSGSPDIGRVDAAEVTDDRILLVGRLAGRATVWEWIGGESRYLFQSTSGLVSGIWSVAGRLAVAVSGTEERIGSGLGRGGAGALWIESEAGEFEEVDLADLATVEAVAGDADTIVVGGSDADARAAIAFVQNGLTVVDRLPSPGGRSAVTDIESDDFSVVALVSISFRGQPAASEIWVSDRGWTSLVETDGLADMVIVDRVIHAAGVDGHVLSIPMSGGSAQATSVPEWSGWIEGVASLGGGPVMFGSSDARPTYAGPTAGSASVELPRGTWERYHSEATEGYELVHVGSLEFAVRGGRLFHRAWNGERWQAASGDLAVYGSPTIIETSYGFVLVPAARGGLWTSRDGETWNRLAGSDDVTIDQVATDGELVVGSTRVGDLDGPASEVTVLDGAGRMRRLSLPLALAGLGWEEDVGFFATVAPPAAFGYATSADGTVWTFSRGHAPFEPVVGLDGALFLASGERVDAGVDADVPTEGGRLLVFDGGVRVWSTDAGETWVHDGSVWNEIGTGALDGLPGPPERLVLVGSRLFAMTEGVDGEQVTFVIELD